jgi:hypothetical protein
VLGYLLLYRWACAGKRVVAVKAGANSNSAVLFCAAGAFDLTDRELRAELDNPAVMSV